MSYDLILKNFVNTYPFLSSEKIIAFELKQKENGEKIGIVSLEDGKTIIKNITPDGITITTFLEIPNFNNNLELRNKFIYDLYKIHKFKQVDIAKFMLMSQSQISNIISSFNKK